MSIWQLVILYTMAHESWFLLLSIYRMNTHWILQMTAQGFHPRDKPADIRPNSIIVAELSGT